MTYIYELNAVPLNTVTGKAGEPIKFLNEYDHEPDFRSKDTYIDHNDGITRFSIREAKEIELNSNGYCLYKSTGQLVDMLWYELRHFSGKTPGGLRRWDSAITSEEIKSETALLRDEPRATKVEGTHASHYLQEAVKIQAQRAQLRDQPTGERSMERIVATFNALTGHTLTEAEGWEFMVVLKMVRGRQGKYNEDDYIDGASYVALLGECESKRDR